LVRGGGGGADAAAGVWAGGGAGGVVTAVVAGAAAGVARAGVRAGARSGAVFGLAWVVAVTDGVVTDDTAGEAVESIFASGGGTSAIAFALAFDALVLLVSIERALAIVVPLPLRAMITRPTMAKIRMLARIAMAHPGERLRRVRTVPSPTVKPTGSDPI
jgi:hypothetical protein